MEEVTVDYNRCTAPFDAISRINWTDEAPTLFINLIRDPSKPGLFNCYNSEGLRDWLLNNDNVFAEWVSKPGYVMDSVGHYGGPIQNGPKYVRLYTPQQNVYLEVDNTVKKIVSGEIDFMIYDTQYLGKKRLGNLQGITTVVSGLHGQAPGEDVYKLITPGQPVKGHATYVPPPPKAAPLVVEIDSESEEGDQPTLEDLHEELMDAIAMNNVTEAKDVIDQGADVTYNNNEALFIAIESTGIPMVQLLIDEGANVNAYVVENRRGKTPLTTAVLEDQLSIAQILINEGADINFRNGFALAFATAKLNPRHVEFLLDNHAKITKSVLETALKTVAITEGETCVKLIVQILGETADLSVLSSNQREQVLEIMREEIPRKERESCFSNNE